VSANSSITHTHTTRTFEEVKDSILTNIRAEVKKMITSKIVSILEQYKQLIQQSLKLYQTEIQATISNVIATEIKSALQNQGNVTAQCPSATLAQNLTAMYATAATMLQSSIQAQEYATEIMTSR
jgi:hypothetical protein